MRRNKIQSTSRAVIGVGLVAASAVPATLWAADQSLSEVTVTNQYETAILRTKVSSGVLGQRAQLDTPFATSIVTAEEIEDRQSTGAADALKYESSVTNASSSNGTHPATLAVRGLVLDDLNGYKVDGLANINRGTEMPLEMFERIEVLKGVSGLMYGFSTPGGTINYVTKRAGDSANLGFTSSYQSNGVFKEHVDYGDRVGEDGQVGYRFNAVSEGGDTALESGKINRQAFGLAVDAQINSDLTLKFDTLRQMRRTVGGTDIITSASYAVPNPVAGTTRLNSNGSFSNVDYLLSTLTAEYKLTQSWKSSLSYRYSDSVRIYKKDQYYIQDSFGRYRDRVTSEYHGYNFEQVQAQLDGHVQTGFLVHDLSMGLMTQSLISTSSVTTPKTYVGYGYITSPTFYTVDSINYSGGTYRDELTRQQALFASDTLTFSEQWSALLGARYTLYNDDTYSTNGVVSGAYTANPWTPTVALMYKPVKQTTVYTSYAQALEQSALAPSTTANANQSFAPLVSKQLEVGVKTEHEDWSGTAALFQLQRGLQYTNDANVYVMDGEAVYRGAELGGNLQATKNLQFASSLMLLNATVTNAASAVNGNRPTGAVDRQASLQVNYRLPDMPELSVHAGAVYVGNMALDASNVNYVPSYTLYDAGFNYRTRIGKNATTWRASVTNLFDTQYWTYYKENYLNVGAPRMLTVSLRVDI